MPSTSIIIVGIKKTLAVFFISAMVFNISIVPGDASFKRLRDLTTDSDPGGYSNHTFTIVANNDVPPGGKVYIDFMLGAWVTLPAPDFRDVDVTIDGVEWSVGANAGFGASSTIGVAIPTGADVYVELTMNDTDSIRASSTIEVEIGDHASFEYTGTRQIRNFAPEGNWFIDVQLLPATSTTPIDEMRYWVNFIDPVVLTVTEVGEPDAPPPPMADPPMPGGSFSLPPGPQLSATEVRIIGKSYPAGSVRVLQDGQLIDTFFTDIFGDFTYSTQAISSGITTVTLVADDIFGNTSVPLALTFFVEANQTTQVSGAFIPPSLDIVVDSSPVRLFGQTIPNADVLLNFSSDSGSSIQVTSSTVEGLWDYYVDTATLVQGETQSVKAQFRFIDSLGGTQVSEFSETIAFTLDGDQIVIEEDPCARSDLNRDGKVNLTDFSILLFNWGTADPTADINQDGSVSLTDFSILLFCWTG